MDPEAVEALKNAGIDVEFRETIPTVAVKATEDGVPEPLGEEVGVTCGSRFGIVRLKRITELFTGDAIPPSFAKGKRSTNYYETISQYLG